MLDSIFNLLFRCKHRSLSRPITPVNLPESGAATYVVCLDCGKQFVYDWKAMRIGRRVEPEPEQNVSRV